MRRSGTSGEDLEHDHHEVVIGDGSIPGIACGHDEVESFKELSGVVLRGSDGFRFSTGRRDGRAPFFPGMEKIR